MKPFNLEDDLTVKENLMSTDNLLSWSEEYEPNETIRYNHILADSPIGKFSIEWKGWKENDGVTIYLDNYYLNSVNTLEEAKEAVDRYLYSKTVHLNELFTRKEEETNNCSAVVEVYLSSKDIELDAKRYRWLRQQHWFSGRLCVVINPKESIKLGSDTASEDRLDNIIDLEMEGENNL